MTNAVAANSYDALGAAIAAVGVDLYLVPMADEFQGEYVPASAARLPYVTGFTGSAGLGAFWKAGATQPNALFVDGRYTLQAAKEVDATRCSIVPSAEMGLTAWLASMGDGPVRIGFDPWLVTEHQLTQWKTQGAENISWVPLAKNLVDGIWVDRPAAPAGAVEVHSLSFAGVSYGEKRAGLLEAMKKHRADALVVTLPDAINWLLNIRGSDIPFNPLLLSYFVLQLDGKSILYLHEHSFSSEVRDYLVGLGVETAPIQTVFDGSMKEIASGARVMMNTAMAHGWFALAEKKQWQVIVADDPTELPKACKNSVELEGIRAAHRRDGLALTKFLHWFDGRVQAGSYPEELFVVDKLNEFRAQDNQYRGPSFATIAGSGPHGAIVHYRATAASNRRAQPGELFLLDSGGQYPDGTTDVTRTIAVGGASPTMIEHATLVLKGHIALASAVFPAGTSGVQLDVLARQHLWAAGLDYDHGTGHGVGAFLCVHEGPQRISKRGSNVALVAGMILSNEPGYYAENKYGIRIENLVVVVEKGHTADGKQLLGFETLTLAPIDARLINVKMLTADERNWLNAYHQRVYKTHADGLDEKGRQWLLQATRAL